MTLDFSLRACGARPSETGSTPGHGPWGGKPRDDVNGVFSEGRTLCARKDGPDVGRGMPFHPGA